MSFHDEHAHGNHSPEEHMHEQAWGDYNAEPPGPSTLPRVGAFALVFFAFALVMLLGSIVFSSFRINSTQAPSHGGGNRAVHTENAKP